jgi:RHS repeat-associated protein
MSKNAYNFTCGYDEMGNRVTKVGNGVNEYYLRDQNGNELAVYKIGTDTISIRNYYGSGLIGKVDSVGNNYFYVKDHLGSIRATLSRTNVVSAQDYYAYGGLITSQSSLGDDRYKFTGKQRDIETGYDYFGARYYDNDLGIWRSVDPMSDSHPGESPYVYCSNNPLIIVDDDGREGHWESLDPAHPDQKSWVLDFVVAYANTETPVTSLAELAFAATVDPEPVTKIILVTISVTIAGIEVINYFQNQQHNSDADVTNINMVNPSTDQLPTIQLNEEKTKEETPESDKGKFDNKAIKGSGATVNKETGEVWEKDKSRHGGKHWEVYKNKRDYENKKRDRQVWEDGTTGKRY